jgi:polyhydroxybutyrate depolymerase
MPAPDASAPETGAEPGPSQGCKNNTLRPGRSMRTIDSGGLQRTYLLYVPPTYDGSKPVPVVVDHHGGGATSMNAERSSGFKELADRKGYLWVAPDGLEMAWGENARDGQFVLDVLEVLEQTACVDRKRIYSTGCSMGAGQTNWLACNEADVFAAVLPVCGTTFFDLAAQCMPSQPMPTMLVIGRDDELNCWDLADEGSKPTRCVDTYRKIFKELNGCTGMERTTHDGHCITVDQCEGGVEVVTCGVAAGHVAYFATDMNVTEEGWKFLSRFHRQR